LSDVLVFRIQWRPRGEIFEQVFTVQVLYEFIEGANATHAGSGRCSVESCGWRVMASSRYVSWADSRPPLDLVRRVVPEEFKWNSIVECEDTKDGCEPNDQERLSHLNDERL
jgi:hypothetical protein